jgi:NAD(P)-dependent dehydrogenase (short-subunit alcohol dehydrogenase family)
MTVSQAPAGNLFRKEQRMTESNTIRPSGSRLANHVTLITGASRGIGRAIAQAYAAEGATVCLAATNREMLAEVQASLELPPERSIVMPLDVTDRAACFAAVEAIEARFGRLDVLVNNAGIYQSKTFLDYAPEDFQRLLDVNLFGVINLMQAALPRMQSRGRGRIVNIASTAGKWGSRNQSAYNVSKHAVVGLTRCVALEAAATGVTVNAICPGFIQTDMVENLKRGYAAIGGGDGDAVVKAALARVPMNRVLEPSEVAALAVYLGSPESAGMTGQSLLIDGGMLLC